MAAPSSHGTETFLDGRQQPVGAGYFYSYFIFYVYDATVWQCVPTYDSRRHVVAMCSCITITRYDGDVVDPKTGHSALDTACMQRWKRAEIETAFGPTAYQTCVRKGLLAPYNRGKDQTFVEPGGGWSKLGYAKQPEYKCGTPPLARLVTD